MTAGLSVILPAYDEAAQLAGNLGRLVRCLEGSGRPFEVIVVDDGSADGTGDIARRVARADARVRVCSHAHNEGKGRALTNGCALAREAIVVLLDADLQIPPEDVLPLVERLERSGADVAVGSKYHPEAQLQWPLGRRVLSRLYHLVTALCFRLPLRDTQTGLKAMHRTVAERLVPHLRSKRFAWDLELVLLAHRAGLRCVTGPVRVGPSDRASRLDWRGALRAGLDTLSIFLRDRGLAAYSAVERRVAGRARVIVSGDDLGLSPSIDEGLLRGLEVGGLTSISVLATEEGCPEAAEALRRRAPHADVGLHLDMLRGRSLFGFLCASTDLSRLRADLQAQAQTLRRLGLRLTHADAHRHAWCLPWTRRVVCRGLHEARIHSARSLRPLGDWAGLRPVEIGKRLVLLGLSTFSAAAARDHGLVVPDGWVDAQEAARWARAGVLPAWTRGRTVEVIAHPALGPQDVPSAEQGTLDRSAEARALREPPLALALQAAGATITTFRALAGARCEADHGD